MGWERNCAKRRKQKAVRARSQSQRILVKYVTSEEDCFNFSINSLDGNMEPQNLYSINKKNRWDLVKTLEEEYPVSISREKANKKVNNVSAVFYEDAYFEECSHTTKGKKKKHVDINPNPSDNKIKYVTYQCVEEKKQKSKKGSLQKSSKVVQNFWENDYEDDLLEDFDLHSNELTENEFMYQNPNNQFCLYDFICEVNVTKPDIKPFRICDEFKKEVPQSNIIYIEKKSNKKTKTETQRIKKEVVMTTITLLIESDSMEVQALENKFGQKYIEIENCFPRRFMINIKSFLENSLLEVLEKFTVKNLNLNVFLVFDLNQKKFPADESTIATRVFLHGNFNSESIFIENINPCAKYTVEEIVHSAVLFLIKVKFDSFKFFSERHCPVVKDISTWPFADAHKYLGCSYEILDHETLELFVDNKCKNQENALMQPDSTDASLCNICYEDMDNANGQIDGMALLPCMHWFCNSCWHNYLTAKFSIGSSHILCPHSHCTTPVSLLVMRTIVSGEDFLNYAIRNSVMRLGQFYTWKWCTNSLCQRIIILTNRRETALNISCLCKSSYCFKCQGELHWPASCESSFHYHTKLKELGYDKIVQPDFQMIESVPVKNCPKCQYPIEKFQGCNHMVCKCGFHFCWLCFSEWKDNFYADHHCTMKERKGQQRIDLVDLKEKKIRICWFDNCVHHHQQRILLEKLLRSFKGWYNHIKIPSKSYCDSVKRLEPDKFQETIVKQKYNKEVVKLTIEKMIWMHHLCEYTIVWIQYNKLQKCYSAFAIKNAVDQLEFFLHLMKQRVDLKKIKSLEMYACRATIVARNLLVLINNWKYS